MVTVDITKRILTAIAGALPEDGRLNVVTRIDVRRGWGNTIYVEVYSGLESDALPIDRTLEKVFTAAVDSALGEERHQVRVHWNYHWQGPAA
ncbi:MAG TPA: hypothetical protein VL961_13010 [Acidimicrobiales bacterium]|nr:hypothetical protein [Acidimicrobiales bacterium]